MRLLNVHTLKLHEFTDSREVEELYTIMSHTWAGDSHSEISFQDVNQKYSSDAERREQLSRKAAFPKVWGACQQAIHDGYEYVWIDTCCIDKTSSSELSEAINSMFQWYATAAVCYAYLSDYRVGQTSRTTLGGCRWFSRGWTLQELIAPSDVDFFDVDWAPVASKSEIAGELELITGIQADILCKRTSFRSTSIAQRMSWAARREVTRIEDNAYALLGIFNVSMSLIYGEGEKAFVRLQEEIVKNNPDHSIFVWQRTFNPFVGRLLALSSDEFVKGGNLVKYSRSEDDEPYVLTNKGLQITLPVREDGLWVYATLNCKDQLSGRSKIFKLMRPLHEAVESATGRNTRMVCWVADIVDEFQSNLGDLAVKWKDLMIMHQLPEIGLWIETDPLVEIERFRARGQPRIVGSTNPRFVLFPGQLGLFTEGFAKVRDQASGAGAFLNFRLDGHDMKPGILWTIRLLWSKSLVEACSEGARQRTREQQVGQWVRIHIEDADCLLEAGYQSFKVKHRPEYPVSEGQALVLTIRRHLKGQE